MAQLSEKQRIAVKEYSERGSHSYKPHFNDSCFGRHYILNPALEEIVSGLSKKPNVLYVGVGRDDARFMNSCASGPIELAAMLGYFGKDYRMTILDLNEDNLKQAEEKEEIWLKPRRSPRSRLEMWGNYLRYVGAVQRRTIRYGDEVLCAEVPQEFRQKIKKNQVSFVRDDIVTMDPLKKEERYELVHCLNVLVHLGKDELVYAALQNLSGLSADNATLVLDREENRVLGWNSRADSVIRNSPELGLCVQQSIDSSISYNYIIARRS